MSLVQSAGAEGLTLLAPAKVNLTLEVLGQRPDGFHEVRSILQTIALWDVLTLEVRPQGIEFRCSWPDLETPENSVLRAGALLGQAGLGKGAAIRLRKGIPRDAGLGGHSSDAAATLAGLNYLWDLGLSREKLLNMASQIGSDTPFFLYLGTALAQGRGENITPLPPLPTRWAVLLRPHISIFQPKTARLYSYLTPKNFTSGEHTQQALNTLSQGGDIAMFNAFEAVAGEAYPGLEKYQETMLRAGASSVHLAGSGLALFSLMWDEREARGLYRRLRKEGLEVYLAQTWNP